MVRLELWEMRLHPPGSTLCHTVHQHALCALHRRHSPPCPTAALLLALTPAVDCCLASCFPCLAGHTATVELLLERRADPTSTNKRNETVRAMRALRRCGLHLCL